MNNRIKKLLYGLAASSSLYIGSVLLYPNLPKLSPTYQTKVKDQTYKEDIRCIYIMGSDLQKSEILPFGYDLKYAKDCMDKILKDHDDYIFVYDKPSDVDPRKLLESVSKNTGNEDKTIIFVESHDDNYFKDTLLRFSKKTKGDKFIFYSSCYSGRVVDDFREEKPKNTAIVSSTQSDTKDPYSSGGLDFIFYSYTRDIANFLLDTNGDITMAFQKTNIKRMNSVQKYANGYSTIGKIYSTGAMQLPVK